MGYMRVFTESDVIYSRSTTGGNTFVIEIRRFNDD